MTSSLTHMKRRTSSFIRDSTESTLLFCSVLKRLGEGRNERPENTGFRSNPCNLQ